MASTTVTTSTLQHPHHRASFSAAGAAPLPSNTPTPAPFDHATSGLAGHVSPSAQQPQPSSQQSFTMSQPSSQQTALASASYRQFNDSSARPSDEPSLIYSAVYSGTNVYEMEVNGIAVMRRRHDSWLNATQILKVAQIDKGKRTKILEKEIQTGEHEKIQGGYGKYQGTWIQFDRAVEVCKQYGVEDLLRPLLTYDMGQDGGVAGQGKFNTPTKEQAMAAQRKRLYHAANETRTNGAAGTFFKGISSTATDMVGIINKARFDSPGPRSGSNGAGRNGSGRAQSFNRQPSMTSADEFPGNSQQSFVSEYAQTVDSAYSTQQNTQQSATGGPEPPRKRQRVGMAPADSFGYPSSSVEMYGTAFPGSPTEPNESFIYSHAGLNAHTPEVPLPPLPFEVSADAENRRNKLMSVFMDNSTTDQSKHEMLRKMTPQELDIPIDTQSHTALHWAATLSRMPLLRTLIAAGASPFRVNAVGETPLMRACLVTNTHEHFSMPDLLDLLGSTLAVRDAKGRTVLHHIAVTSSVKGRCSASRYYLQSLLEWVVRQGSQGSAPSSQNTQQPNGSQSSNPTKLGLGRFMSEIVNAQDKAGDTALNIAAKIGNQTIISELLEVWADPKLANRQGLRPLDFGVGVDNAGEEVNGEAKDSETNGVPSSQKSRESSDDIVTSITHLVSETESAFQDELKTKQQAVESLHASIRTTNNQLSETRRALEAAEEKVKKQQLARQQVYNLTRAHEEEQYHLAELERVHGRMDIAGAASWEAEADAAVNAANTGANVSSLPSAALLRARINAVRARTEETRRAEHSLKGRSREDELKFRHLVALAVKCTDAEVDAHVDGLMRAVESEKGELEIGRVRRFLGGVEGVVH